jgi:hypothetical protein
MVARVHFVSAIPTKNRHSLVPLELAPTPMLVLSIRIERPNDVSVQCAHHPDVRVHQRPAIFRCHQHRFAGA